MTTPQDPYQQGQQPPPYPSAPPPPAGEYMVPPPPPLGQHELGVARPKDVDTSFLLWIASIVVGLIGGILAYAMTSDAQIEEARRQAQAQGDFTQEQIDTIINASKIIGLVIGLIILGLWLLFIFLMRNGKNWARIVLTVLAGLGLVLNLIGIATEPAPEMIATVVQTVLVVAAIVFMYRPAANAYFKAR